METRLRAFHNPTASSSEKNCGNLALSVEARHALAAWVRAKQSLERVMRREDFQGFVRPMYLIAVLSGCYVLLSVPPNRRLYERARNFRGNVAAAVEQQNYRLAGFTPYPSADQLFELRSHQSFRPFIDLIWQKRMEKLAGNRPAEDERDRADLTEALREARA